MKLEKILFIDDRIDLFQDTITDLEEAGIQVVQLDGSEALDDFLLRQESFDAVILDWYFGDASEIAQLCLRKIMDARFVPVLVWTEEPEAFVNDLPKISFFPESCIKSVRKGEVEKGVMVEYVNTWFQGSTATSLSSQWRSSGTKAIERSLYRLAELDDEDVSRALRVFVRAGEQSADLNLDHAVEVLARLLQRELIGDSELSSFLRERLSAGGVDPAKVPSKVLRLHMYYSPEDDLVRTGDVVDFGQGDTKRVALVATPSCDLANPKTEYLRLIVIGPTWEGSNKPTLDRCDLPFLLKEGKDYQNKEARFQEVISLKNLKLAEGKDVKARKSVMLYSHQYETMGGQKATVARILRVDDPYRTDLLQRFAAHASRVGVPDFK